MLANPVEVARDAIEADSARRAEAAEARRVYEDDGEAVTRHDLERYINDRTRRDRIGAFAHLAQCNNLVRRIIDDKVSPVYAQSPTRKTDPESAQKALSALVTESSLDAKHDKALRLSEDQGAACEMFRYVPRLKSVVVDVIPIDRMTVIPDPDDNLRELAVAYARPIRQRVGNQTITVNHWVVWDDEQVFTLDENFRRVNMVGPDGKYYTALTKANGQHPGVLPFVVVHSTERAGTYWNVTAGRSLVATHKAITFLLASAIRLVKVQGHQEKVLTGDPSNFPKNQTLDPEQLLIAGAGNTINAISNATDPAHFLKVADAITMAVGANHGLNRELLNAQVRTETDSVALLEHRQRIIKRAGWLEQQAFEKLKVAASAHDDPEKRIPEATRLSVDFAEMSHRLDRKALLENWKTEWGMALSNPVQAIRFLNPELRTDEEALAQLEHNTEVYATVVDLVRKLNIRTDGSPADPSTSSRENGAMGSKVRDGKMTRDEADEASRTGKPATS